MPFPFHAQGRPKSLFTATLAKNGTASPIRLRENSRLSAAGGAATSAASAASTSASSGLSSSTTEAGGGNKETTAARAKRRRLRKEHDDGGGDLCGRLPKEKQHLAAIILAELNRKMGSVVWSPT